MMVRMFQPTTVRKAFTLAKLYESVNTQPLTVPFSSKTCRPTLAQKPLNTNQIEKAPTTNSLLPKPKTQTTRTLTPAYMSKRRAKGLCYFCDQPFTTEHSLTHQKLQIHVMEIGSPTTSEEEEQETEEGGIESVEPQISVNALTGVPCFRTMRVTGYYKKNPIHILIDSGSTHNFLDVEVTKKLACKIEDLKSLHVTVADRSRLSITSIVKQFKWTIQNTAFYSDMMLIPLGCCDLVLGKEWMVTLGDITWNFDKQSMEFKAQGRKHVLRGASSSRVSTIKWEQVKNP
uniref:Uncharacterized protein n=1 Tax=Cajanus cajan TaxID=3821 RepID=A0A151R0X9_CAJCA|nr:hypothetical protein KK1_042735 [Cajanus cajan]